jgi:hypothetical protein
LPIETLRHQAPESLVPGILRYKSDEKELMEKDSLAQRPVLSSFDPQSLHELDSKLRIMAQEPWWLP